MIVAMLALIGATTAGCLQVPPQPPLPPTTMSSWGPNGGFTLSSGMSTCAGHATLNAGHTSVTDPCFTGVDNIVMCTDTSTANAVQCSPSSGYLAISWGRKRHNLIRTGQIAEDRQRLRVVEQFVVEFLNPLVVKVVVSLRARVDSPFKYTNRGLSGRRHESLSRSL